MSHTFTIKPCFEKHSVMRINPSQALELGLDKKIRGNVSFGIRKHSVEIEVSDKVEENEIYLSQNVISELYLPGCSIFEICVKEDKIVIGPYIGILTKYRDASLTKRCLKSMLIYTREYSKLHGALVVFALNKFNNRDQLIEGYCYNPHIKSWERGTFPYPASIFCKFPLKKRWRNHLISTIGNTWFNSYFVNKWEMHQFLSPNPVINPHLPYTILYQSYQDIFDSLEKYKKVLLKPIGGLQGKRIAQIRLENEEIIFKYKRKGESVVAIERNLDDIKKLIEKLFVPGKYIIQQHIDLIQYENSVIDFRCIMQKDQTTNWKCLGIIGRISAPNCIITNIHNGGSALPLMSLLKKYSHLSEDEILNVEEKISRFSLEIGNALDEIGVNYGNLGLDVGMDKTGHLWLIEVNNRNPNPGTDQFTGNKALYYKTKTTPLFYAKALAGFKLEDKKEKT